MSQKKLKVGVLGATGMVGQRFVALLENHPWYEVTLVAASANSAGQKYADAVKGRWALSGPPPSKAAALTVHNASDVARIAAQVDFAEAALFGQHDARSRRPRGFGNAGTLEAAPRLATSTIEPPLGTLHSANQPLSAVVAVRFPILRANPVRASVNSSHSPVTDT